MSKKTSRAKKGQLIGRNGVIFTNPIDRGAPPAQEKETYGEMVQQHLATVARLHRALDGLSEIERRWALRTALALIENVH